MLKFKTIEYDWKSEIQWAKYRKAILAVIGASEYFNWIRDNFKIPMIYREILPIYKEKVKELGMLCGYCGDVLQVKNGKYGKFLGCSNYPKCKYTRQI